MYKCLFRTLLTAQNSAGSVYEACLLAAKRNKTSASIFRISNGAGVKCLSTGSVKLCQKSDGVGLSEQDGKVDTEKECEHTETKPLAEQKATDDDNSLKISDKQEEAAVLMTNDEGTKEQNISVITEQDAAKPETEKAVATKSEKEMLLDLLSGMKVEVTNKRKLKNPMADKEYAFMSKPTPIPTEMESTISMFQKATVEASSQSETLNPELVAAASAAASTLPNSSQAESELLQQLRQHESITEAQKKGDSNIGLIIANMKVGRGPNRQNTRPTNQIRFDEDEQMYTRDRGITNELDSVWKRKKLFTVKRLNIFVPPTDEDAVEPTVARPTLWDVDFANQLSLLTDQMPQNGIEEMILWTKQGKVWQYPINNEDGLEEEANVPFHEHVFLEKHLEEGFPRQGPVRHFMDLVVAGLSKNPYLTVQQKKDHISWFRDYFHQKEDVLKEADTYLN
ncbi:small ribosomal subunit protein mS31 [Sphaeramia orbicularis]|uniref:small ribosomal subunit protein mS31 n=1 Tax=Sphaeramia orbicularis TaxID=375764 RepID=UPI00117E3DA4|nr:28S ribosomal protein S31, mitochondrial [Sphaeramia orbicularis]